MVPSDEQFCPNFRTPVGDRLNFRRRFRPGICTVEVHKVPGPLSPSGTEICGPFLYEESQVGTKRVVSLLQGPTGHLFSPALFSFIKEVKFSFPGIPDTRLSTYHEYR